MKPAKFLLFLMCALMGTSGTSLASPRTSPMIPPQLAPWTSWVLYGHENHACPSLFNNGRVYKCIWPSRLTLDINPSGGKFSQQWLVFKEGFVPLPGSGKFWPEKVTENGKPRPVIEKEGMPSILLKPGNHLVTGLFRWRKIPEMIPVSPLCGLVSLAVQGKSSIPVLDAAGHLWLRRKNRALAIEDTMDIRAFRLIEDSIPLQITTLLKLNIAGHPREISLKGSLLKGAAAMGIKSPLPARLSSDGTLRIQARPGQWRISVRSYFNAHIKTLQAAPIIGRQEIWSFKPDTSIRMVKIKGVPALDPKQTDLPAYWKQYAAYLITPGSKVIFQEHRRGDPSPAPDQLSLKRTWWLDFNGKGLTIQDRITGTIRRSWRLNARQPEHLGHVSIDGRDQLITHLGKAGQAGVELRKGRLHMVADLRLNDFSRTIPAVGWNHDFQSVSGFLNLPPGWHLLGITGPDTVRGTWIQKWTLLDLFLVLIIAMIVARLFGLKWAFLAFVALVLTYHERGAPRLVWLSVLVPIALLRFFPEGWFATLVKLWRIGAIVVLLVISLPFMVQQVRVGFYPQLEPVFRRGTPSPYAREMALDAARPGRKRREKLKIVRKYAASKTKYSYSSQQSLQRTSIRTSANQKAVFSYDPNARAQTGPGIPTWKWRGIPVKWNGPVEKNQTLRLWLLSPGIVFFIAILRVLFLAGFLYLCTGLRHFKKANPIKSLWLAGTLVLVFLLPFFSPAPSCAAGFPPQPLLDKLQKRLLRPPDCLPNCAAIPRMDLNITRNSLRILLKIHAAVDTSVPLPGNLNIWQPSRVLLDQKLAKGLFRDASGTLWLFCPRGIHQAVMTGIPPHGHSFQLPFTLKPHSVTTSEEGWRIRGFNEDRQVLSTLQFIRREKEAAAAPSAVRTSRIPPFFHVIRTLSLGLQWHVLTTVQRLTPTGTPLVLEVPLLKGESVISGFEAHEGKITLSFKSETKSVRWRSLLAQSNTLRLASPVGAPWTETWILDVSPIWHCTLSGIPVVHQQGKSGYWQPTWRPWPGEKVTIKVTRPPAITGENLTIDRVKIALEKGKRYNRIHLSLKIKASQGQQYTLKLPPRAKLQSVHINGKVQPIQIRGGKLTLPLQPGSQSLKVMWLQPASSSMVTQLPPVDIGHNAVNASLTCRIPANRLILWTHGPTLGPAVLFWSYLIVILLCAAALGKIRWTPLKTRHWILLGLGLTQVHPLVSLLIVGWLLALGIRKKEPPAVGSFRFNLAQIILVLWTSAAMIGLYVAITKGLLGIPEMQIAGNGSSSGWLQWTQDRVAALLPQPWVLSLPLIVFRGLMLLWALWLAYSLIHWLRWGWDCFNSGGGWKKLSFRSKKTPKTKKTTRPAAGTSS